jgi:cytochrome c
MKLFVVFGILLAFPTWAQDIDRGRLLYETHCGTCHYERVHDRPRERSLIKSRADLSKEVAYRATLTGRRFSADEIEDVADYLDRSHYKFPQVSPASLPRQN